MTSAGEVEQYVYCPHNWLLARQGFDPKDEGSRRGAAEHRRKGAALQAVEARKRAYRRGFATSMAVLAAATGVLAAALALAAPEQPKWPLLLAVGSLVLVGAAAGLLWIALTARKEYKEQQVATGIVPGRLVQSDLAGQAPLLEDPAWDLAGRPDYLMETAHGPVPVEVKTGWTPEHPYPSHVLQVACYLHLVETATGRRPEYGLLEYPQGVFRVEWNDALRAQLKDTLGRIAQSRASGVADRDHDQPGRCRGCARRDACGQRLA